MELRALASAPPCHFEGEVGRIAAAGVPTGFAMTIKKFGTYGFRTFFVGEKGGLFPVPSAPGGRHQSAAADKQQGQPEGEAVGVPGRRSLLSVVRLFGQHYVCLVDLLCRRSVGEVLAASVAEPVFDVAVGALSGRLGGEMHKVGVAGGIQRAVCLAADLAHSLVPAGGGAAGMACGGDCRALGQDGSAAETIDIAGVAVFGAGSRSVAIQSVAAGVVALVRLAVSVAAAGADGLSVAGGGTAGMRAAVAALGTDTVFPLMGFLGYQDRAAAGPFLLMGGRGLHPVEGAGVMLRIPRVP